MEETKKSKKPLIIIISIICVLTIFGIVSIIIFTKNNNTVNITTTYDSNGNKVVTEQQDEFTTVTTTYKKDGTIITDKVYRNPDEYDAGYSRTVITEYPTKEEYTLNFYLDENNRITYEYDSRSLAVIDHTSKEKLQKIFDTIDDNNKAIEVHFNGHKADINSSHETFFGVETGPSHHVFIDKIYDYKNISNN